LKFIPCQRRGDAFGYMLDLATFVNERRNLFKITRELNRKKKDLVIQDYHNDDDIVQYWESRTDNEGEETVGKLVTDLVLEMRN
jgi:hypothetical protein